MKSILKPMDLAIKEVRKGRMTRLEASKVFKVHRYTLGMLCNALGIKSALGRPKGKK